MAKKKVAKRKSAKPTRKKKVEAVPKASGCLIPGLALRGASDAIAFYKKVFGAKELSRMSGPDGKVMHAELRFGDRVLFVGEEAPEMGAPSPQTLGGSAVSLMHYVKDVDAVFARAVAAGAKPDHAPRRHVLGGPVRDGARPVGPPLGPRHPQGRPHAEADDEGHERVDGLAGRPSGMRRPAVNRVDAEALARARAVLEKPGLAIRLTDLVGRPVEMAVAALPAAASRQIHRATGAALDRALSVALRTMDADPDPPSDWLHRLAVGATGAGGGAFGLAGLAVELPVSTAIMLRAIADHARAQGEDLARPEPRLQCLSVFAYGSPRAADDAADAGYFAVRAALARSVAEAAEFLASKGVSRAAADRSAPALARLLTAVARRFGVAVTEKAAAQLVPLLGAAGGAAVNLAFMNHYQRTAWGHFTVRRLERVHGEEAVRAAWAKRR